MRRELAAVLSALGMASAVVAIGGASAFALSSRTWSVKPGGSITGTSSGPTLTYHSITVRCASSSLAGHLSTGTGLTGRGIGRVTKLTFSSCNGPLGSITIAGSGLPYRLNASSYGSGRTHGSIIGIHLNVSMTGCSYVLDGTAATADDGMLSASYSNRFGTLTLGGRRLTLYNVSGCLGRVENGDHPMFSGTYKVSPKQKITSP